MRVNMQLFLWLFINEALPFGIVVFFLILIIYSNLFRVVKYGFLLAGCGARFVIDADDVDETVAVAFEPVHPE